MAEYIYARVSTGKQNTEAQLLDLVKLYPGAKVLTEKVSGVKQKPVLNQLVTELTPGDTLIVYALDRLGRRLSEILVLVESLISRRIKIKTLRDTFDYENPYSRAMLQMMGVFAELERDLIRARIQAGVRSAIESGVQWGFKPKIPKHTITAAALAVRSGASVAKAAAEFGISKRYLYYALAEG